MLIRPPFFKTKSETTTSYLKSAGGLRRANPENGSLADMTVPQVKRTGDDYSAMLILKQKFADTVPPVTIMVRTAGLRPCRWSGYRTGDMPPRLGPAANDG